MKFVVYSVPATSWVKLELYIDTTDGLKGGTWNLVHETLEVAAGGAEVPAECVNDTPNGSPVYGPRDDCFLRSDSSYVYWKNKPLKRVKLSHFLYFPLEYVFVLMLEPHRLSAVIYPAPTILHFHWRTYAMCPRQGLSNDRIEANVPDGQSLRTFHAVYSRTTVL